MVVRRKKRRRKSGYFCEISVLFHDNRGLNKVNRSSILPSTCCTALSAFLVDSFVGGSLAVAALPSFLCFAVVSISYTTSGFPDK